MTTFKSMQATARRWKAVADELNKHVHVEPDGTASFNVQGIKELGEKHPKIVLQLLLSSAIANHYVGSEEFIRLVADGIFVEEGPGRYKYDSNLHIEGSVEPSPPQPAGLIGSSESKKCGCN